METNCNGRNLFVENRKFVRKYLANPAAEKEIRTYDKFLAKAPFHTILEAFPPPFRMSNSLDSASFFTDVASYEGPEVARSTAQKMKEGQAPLLAIFNARKAHHAAALMATNAMFAESCDSTRD